MLSVIVSSVDDNFFFALEKNIKCTIGITYELLRIVNKNGRFGIAEAYNQGAAKAKYPYLCFVHEDVEFQTNNWGLNAVNHFIQNEKLGGFGVAGSIVKSAVISTWFYPKTENIEFNRYNYIASSKKNTALRQAMYVNPFNDPISKVVCLDGVILFARKTVWELNKFDEKLLKHFHGYDLDFSLQVLQSWELAVVYDILLVHISDGAADAAWVKENFKVHKKWKNILPCSLIDDIKKTSRLKVDRDTFKYSIGALKKERGTFWLQTKMLLFFLPKLLRFR